jgi:hypothetical protein
MPKEIDAITKLYDYLLWMIPKLERFPRTQKFILAERIETLMLDILSIGGGLRLIRLWRT